MKQAPGERADARGLRIALLRSAFNAKVVDGLVAGARAALVEMGATDERVAVVDVPGAFELPLAARAAAQSGRFDAVVALGAVIRGGTDHYEHIAREAAAGLARVALVTGVPVGFGVLTCATEDQALARSARGGGNKGAEAARAAVAMVHVVRGLTETKGTGPQRTQRKGNRRRSQSNAVGAPAGRTSSTPERNSLPRGRNVDGRVRPRTRSSGPPRRSGRRGGPR